MTVHQRLISNIKDRGWQALRPFIDISEPSFNDICFRLFLNFRTHANGSTQGLRLSQEGVSVLKQYFKFWVISLPEDVPVTIKEILFLDAACRSPWYLHFNSITLFDADFAMQLKLAGDLTTMEEVYVFKA